MPLQTLYWVRLQALSERGSGVLSDPVKARTLPLAPKAPDVMPVQVHPNNTGPMIQTGFFYAFPL